MSESIGVIGAGAAGLAAAWRLQTAGRRVRLYEASPVAGGRLRTESLSGTRADAAVQLLSAGYVESVALAESLGVASLLVRAPGRDALWRGGRIHALRYGSVSSMAVSGALPAGLKLRMLRYAAFLERHAADLDLNAPARAESAGLGGETVAEWGAREMGEDFVELLAYPLLAAYYGITPEETSAGFFHALARAGMGVEVLGVRGGMAALAESALGALVEGGAEARLGTPVTAVRPEGESVLVEWVGGEERHPAAVVAVSGRVAAGLVPDLRLSPAATTARTTGALVLALDSPAGVDWFGLSVPRTERPGAEIAAVCVQESKKTGLVPAGRGAVTVVPAPAVAEQWFAAEPRAVLERTVPALESLLPGVAGKVVEARRIRLEGGLPPGPGYYGQVRGAASAGPDRVTLAGDWLVAPTVEGAVRSGLAAADRVLSAGW